MAEVQKEVDKWVRKGPARNKRGKMILVDEGHAFPYCSRDLN